MQIICKTIFLLYSIFFCIFITQYASASEISLGKIKEIPGEEESNIIRYLGTTAPPLKQNR